MMIIESTAFGLNELTLYSKSTAAYVSKARMERSRTKEITRLTRRRAELLGIV